MRMLDKFYKELVYAEYYIDFLQLIVTYYIAEKNQIWYLHLLENKKSLKKQSQIGILHDMPQNYVSRKLMRVQQKVRQYIDDLLQYKASLLYILNTIKLYGTVKQQEVLVRYFQHKSFRRIAKELNINYSTVRDHINSFKMRLSSLTDQRPVTTFYTHCELIRKL